MERSNGLEDMLSLHGHAALVVGAGGAIGSSIAEILLAAEAELYCVDLPGREGPTGSETVACDVTDPGEVESLLDRIKEETGRLDVLVHCAGITSDAVIWKLADDDWRRVLATNLDSAFYLLRAAAPLLRQAQNGSVVLIASINGERGKFGQANYVASKAGLIGLARTAARELGRFGVRVNVVAPGMVSSPMTAGLPEEIVQKAIDESVLGRIGRPEDVARAVLFLCSDLSLHVTGQVLRVDGGQLIA